MLKLYAGSYTDNTKSKGIYTMDWDGADGLRIVAVYPERNPSFLTIHGQYLFAANEVPEQSGMSAYRIEPDGSLSFLDRFLGSGADTCALCVAEDGQTVLGANYSSGSITVAPFDGERFTHITEHAHKGRSIIAGRQDAPHVHSITALKGNYIAADLGLDKLFRYELEPKGLRLIPWKTQPFVKVDPGEGPRHLCVSPDIKRAYLNTELRNSIVTFAIEDDGALVEIHCLKSIHEAFEGCYVSDICVTSDNHFLYVGVRGADKIAVIGLDENGIPVKTMFMDCGGICPRSMCLGPEDQTLLVANMHSGTLAIFERNGVNGDLRKIHALDIPGVSAMRWKKL